MEDICSVSQEIEGDTHVSIGMENINTATQDIKKQDDPVVTSVNKIFETLSPLSSECCIYKIPKPLRKINAEAYTPQVVSIGPYHRGEKHLQAMEEHKFRYLEAFLNRTNLSLEDCLEVVRKWEERARNCYAETIELSSDDFVTMILVDGAFIVELLLRRHFRELIAKGDRELIAKGDRIFYKPWMIKYIVLDMMLLENQLPFLVLEGFFNLLPIFSNQNENPSLLDLTFAFFRVELMINELPITISSPKIEHFVDFIRHCYLSSFPQVHQVGDLSYKRSPSVTELHEAGIKFKSKTNSSLFDLKFANGIFEIPPLVIHDNSEILFRNLIGFEQCHYSNNYIIQYMCLLDDMINTSKDVDLLIRHKIITNRLSSSEDVAVLFNNIGKEVCFNDFYISSLVKDLKSYCGTRRHKWKATLKRDYFKTPWAIISIIAGIVLLVLTFVQTLFTVVDF